MRETTQITRSEVLSSGSKFRCYHIYSSNLCVTPWWYDIHSPLESEQEAKYKGINYTYQVKLVRWGLSTTYWCTALPGSSQAGRGWDEDNAVSTWELRCRPKVQAFRAKGCRTWLRAQCLGTTERKMFVPIFSTIPACFWFLKLFV